ncbi:MAG TPA: PAS domain S-box protein, partial [Prolixibacteraceae bacterium]|nr:PAS domain S-box protein [Prolixibacteraceae bacterium]
FLKEALINSINESVIVTDLEGKIIYWNKAAEELYKWKSKEVVGRSILEVTPSTTTKKQAEEIMASLKNGDSWEGEFEVKDKNGELFPVHVKDSPLLDSKGNLIGIIGGSRDISKQVKYLKLAKENEEKYRTLYENAPLPYQSLNEYGGFKDINPAWISMLGYKKDEVIGKCYKDFLHPDWQSNFDKHFSLFKKRGYVKDAEFKIQHKDGSYLDVAHDGLIGYNPDGSFKQTYCVLKDITAFNKKESELVKIKEKAEEADRLKSAFLANMSHEIRTPMNGILGFTNLLQDHDLTGEQQQQYIEIIKKSGYRMLNTVNDIIEISKIETGQIKVSTTKVNVNEHLLTLHVFFSFEAEKKGLKLIIDNKLSEDESLVITDNNKLSSILSNFIKNAIKFTKKGAIKIGCKKKADLLEFYVEDTGAGIPSDRKKAIFNRFEQADIEDKQVHEGSGLGLAIVKSYVEMLGGSVWVESEENKGSTFFFTISYNPAKSESKNKINVLNKIPHKAKNLNILIVEDDDTSSLYLSTILKDIAKNIQIARDGLEAVEICKNNSNFDLVLMDFKMPGMNGLKATEKIRKFNNKVKIIAQTAHALEGDREKAIIAGCDDYISKPIDEKKLIALIEKINISTF